MKRKKKSEEIEFVVCFYESQDHENAPKLPRIPSRSCKAKTENNNNNNNNNSDNESY